MITDHQIPVLLIHSGIKSQVFFVTLPLDLWEFADLLSDELMDSEPSQPWFDPTSFCQCAESILSAHNINDVMRSTQTIPLLKPEGNLGAATEYRNLLHWLVHISKIKYFLWHSWHISGGWDNTELTQPFSIICLPTLASPCAGEEYVTGDMPEQAGTNTGSSVKMLTFFNRLLSMSPSSYLLIYCLSFNSIYTTLFRKLQIKS